MTDMNTELALQRTKFSNQRTYLSYMRTGFAIAIIAGTFKKILGGIIWHRYDIRKHSTIYIDKS